MPRILVCLLLTSLALTARAEDALPLEKIKLPPGFQIELLARVPNARAMALGKDNVLYVGSTGSGRVHALELGKDFKAGKLHEIASGLTMPLGVAYLDGNLYVTAIDRILRFNGIDGNLETPPKPVVLPIALPKERHHGGRFIAAGPDGLLYVGVGAPCNVCEPTPDRYAVILRMKPDGTQSEVFARGIRNTVGFDWQPGTKELWFTENGRDMLGDNIPPDELNRAPKAGMHFGFPYCHAGTIADPEFGSAKPCSAFTPPVQALPPHGAALGMRFYTGNQFPAAYRQQVFIAHHGSWNRSEKSGYQVGMVKVDGSKATGFTPFATGWLQGQTPWGRPADILMLPDGSMLVSDDLAGAIYRIRYAS